MGESGDKTQNNSARGGRFRWRRGVGGGGGGVGGGGEGGGSSRKEKQIRGREYSVGGGAPNP